MDVGIVTAPMDFGPSGPNVYLENLCEQLIADDEHDLTLHLIHYRESNNPIYDEVHDVILPRTPGRFERGVSRLDLDVLHYNYIPYKRPLVFALDVNLIATVHGDFAFAMPEYVSWKRRWLEVPLQRLYARAGVLDRIAEYVTVSDALGGSLDEYLGIPDSKVTTVYPGIADRFEPVPDAVARLEDAYELEAPFLLNVNNYMEKKNRETLIHAFDRIHDEYPELSLVFAGGGWEDSTIESEIRDRDLQESITDMGFVPADDLPILYSAAELLVNPTLRETFGFTNLEAMACGCPVVTSNKFAIPEVVGDGAALITDPLDPEKIVEVTTNLLADDDERCRLVARGSERAEQFNWRRTAENMIEVYRKHAE